MCVFRFIIDIKHILNVCFKLFLLKEKNELIVNAQVELCRIQANMQQLPLSEYKRLKKKADKVERSVIANLEKSIERKVDVFKRSRKVPNSSFDMLSPKLNITSKRRKHRRTQREVRLAYDKRRRFRKKEQKKLLVLEEIKKIKESNLVKNFSNEEIPDSAYLFLALGSTFCTKQLPKLHDYVFDAKEFCRKLAWCAFHEDKKRKESPDDTELRELFQSDEEMDDFQGFTDADIVTTEAQVNNGKVNGWTMSNKLKIKSRKSPDFKDTLLSSITERIKNGVRQIEMPKRRSSNLTLLEAEGMRWCKKAVKERRLYFTKVDKGGCIMILNTNVVDDLMNAELRDIMKFKQLEDDPRDLIKKKIKSTLSTYAEENLISKEDLFLITGLTAKRGMSHGHEFVVKKPHMYPLFKIHKLTHDEIQQKLVPPTRMVTSGVAGPTYRLGLFLDSVLKPVVQEYCKGELVKDSTDFIKELIKMEGSGTSKSMNLIGTLDVTALYPSIRLDLALEALEDALCTSTNFSEQQIEMILHLARICIENSVIHYRGTWYCSILGLPTGGPESGSLANIFVFFLVQKKLLVHPDICCLNKISNRKRFLDDIWFGWHGTFDQFSMFIAAVNKVGKTCYGITFTGGVGSTVDFLDVSITLKCNGELETKMFIKPTDASRYLHRRSDHGPHTFRSTPFSQFRRAIVICSNEEHRTQSITYMAKKFIDSGYKQTEIDAAREKALQLDRKEILGPAKITEDMPSQSSRQLTFVINRDGYMCKSVKKILADNKHDIETLLGQPTRIIVAERRTNNIASMLFAKSSFSRNIIPVGIDQECKGGNGCLCCKMMRLERNVVLWKDHPAYKTTVRLDFRCNCTTENVIYLYICKLCESNTSFYVGQTIGSARGRANGHRSSFNNKAYTKSALSYHIFVDHPEHFRKKLLNFDLGVIKSTSATNLDRMEDYYVELTRADLSLNRYKVVS